MALKGARFRLGCVAMEPGVEGGAEVDSVMKEGSFSDNAGELFKSVSRTEFITVEM